MTPPTQPESPERLAAREIALKQCLENSIWFQSIYSNTLAIILKHTAAREKELKPSCNCIDWGATGCLQSCDNKKTWKQILDERDNLQLQFSTLLAIAKEQHETCKLWTDFPHGTEPHCGACWEHAKKTFKCNSASIIKFTNFLTTLENKGEK